VEKRIVLRGLLVGAVGGVLAFVFTRIFAEPLIQRAIDYESAREQAQDALDTAAGRPVGAGGADIVSRAVQANFGLGLGVIAFGAAMGVLFAVAYTICLGRVGNLRPRTLSVLVAVFGFLGLFLVPFVKYPANPPAIGHEETIRQRSALYMIMVLASVGLLILAVVLGQRLKSRLGNWNATLVAAGAFVVVIGVLMAVLPPLGHLSFNVENYGRQATETPLPLTDPSGTIVFPGFPADVLFQFRLYAVAAQAILWAVIGLGFAPLAERLLGTRPVRAAAAEQAESTESAAS
jgi:predicted cobalt transporter CbtA